MPHNAKKKGPYNIDLQNAVSHLYDKKIIRKDAEIVEKLGSSRGQVSNYVNGRAPASENFRNSFEKAFNLKLSEFAMPQDQNGPVDAEDSYRAKYIKKLEDDNDLLTELIRDNQEIIKNNLTLVLATVRTISVRQEANGNVALESLARLEKKKDEKALVDEADKRTVQIETAVYAHGNPVG